MRSPLLLAIALLAACNKKPAGPDPDFKNDVTVFCGATGEGPMSSIAELGPRILDRIRTERFKHLFDMRREDPTGALFDRLDAAVNEVGLTDCPTLDWMRNGMKPGTAP